jgi:polysaccharide export outer membrane protein
MQKLTLSLAMSTMRVSQLGLFLWGVLFAAEAAPQKTAKELVEYIKHAQQIGLKDNKIRQNAIAAGWDKTQVDEAFVILRYITTHAGDLKPGADTDNGNTSDVSEYRIGAGDVLQIAVWKEPEASVPTAVVRPDGKLTLPLVKEVEVVGLTPVELQKLLAEKLQKYILDADVTVVAKEINSQKVNLIGAVRKEGPIPILGKTTVLQAINENGGLTDYAKRKKIYVLRMVDGKQTRFAFDYEAVIQGENMEQNIVLRPNDMIVVPQ